MSDTFEIVSRITDEISEFLDDIGIDPIQYEYDYSYDEDNKIYSASVRVIRGEIEGVCDAFSGYQEEFADHMAVSFPEIEVKLTLLIGGSLSATDGSDISAEEDEEEYETLSTEEDSGDGEDDGPFDIYDDEDSADTDSVERQYEDEGLCIVDEDDEDQFYTEEIEKIKFKHPEEYIEDDDDEDEDYRYSRSRSRTGGTKSDELEDEAYRPSAEDMEDLWSTFGVSFEDD